jgi:excisionase family DNA binding protein
MNSHEDLPTVTAAVPADAWRLEPLLDVAELAAYLGVPVSTVYDWRTQGEGPAAYRFGRHFEVRRLGREGLGERARSGSARSEAPTQAPIRIPLVVTNRHTISGGEQPEDFVRINEACTHSVRLGTTGT